MNFRAELIAVRAVAVLVVGLAIAAGAYLALDTRPRLVLPGRLRRPITVVAPAPTPEVPGEPVATVLPPEIPDVPVEDPWPPPLMNPHAFLRTSWDLSMGRPGAHEILFSFDDGPNPGTTDRLLPMLDRAGVRAVFFVCGWRLEAEEPLRSRARAILRNTLARGHVIGNHTVHHRVLPNLSTAQITYEIDHNADLIEEVIGQRPHLFRPPYGAYSEDVRRLVTARRYELWLWSLDSHDWQRVNDADGVAQAVITLIGNHAGGTVLLHDTHPWSVAAVPRILRWIEETNRERLHDRRPPYTIMDAPRYFAGARERLRTLPGAATARDGGLDDAPEPTTGAVGGGDPDAQGSDAPTVDAVADDHS